VIVRVPQLLKKGSLTLLLSQRETFNGNLACSEGGDTFGNILLSENERLATLDWVESTGLADGALELEGDLLGGLRLLSEDGLGLASETCLLSIVSSLSLSDSGSLACLILGHLVGCVL